MQNWRAQFQLDPFQSFTVGRDEEIGFGDCAARATLLKLEEEAVERQCAEIIRHKPDVVITEKGLSDLAMHFLTKAGISAIRRLRKTDNNRIARATGATIVHRCGGCVACHGYTPSP